METYTYSGDKLTKAKVQSYSYSNNKYEANSTVTYTTAYNKKGLPVKETSRISGVGAGPIYTFAYDAQGNMKKYTASWMTIKYTNKYDKLKRMTSRTQTSTNPGSTTKSTTKFTYKKITVKNAALAKKIKAQQWAIINGNYNYAIGGKTYN